MTALAYAGAAPHSARGGHFRARFARQRRCAPVLGFRRPKPSWRRKPLTRVLT
jgi:hypothetical protein